MKKIYNAPQTEDVQLENLMRGEAKFLDIATTSPSPQTGH